MDSRRRRRTPCVHAAHILYRITYRCTTKTFNWHHETLQQAHENLLVTSPGVVLYNTGVTGTVQHNIYYTHVYHTYSVTQPPVLLIAVIIHTPALV